MAPPPNGQVIGALAGGGIGAVLDTGGNDPDGSCGVLHGGDGAGRPPAPWPVPRPQDPVRLFLPVVVDGGHDGESAAAAAGGIGGRTSEDGLFTLGVCVAEDRCEAGVETRVRVVEQRPPHRDHHLGRQLLTLWVRHNPERLCLCRRRCVHSDEPVVEHPIDGAVASFKGVLWILPGVIEGGAPDRGHQGGGLGNGELVERLAKILLRSGDDPVGVGAEEHRVGVELEDLLFGETALELGCHLRLADLAFDGPVRAEEVLLDHLLGDGGSPALPSGERRPEDGPEVDSGVLIETLVLGREQRIDHHDRHLIERCRLAVAFGQLPELNAVAGDDRREP